MRAPADETPLVVRFRSLVASQFGPAKPSERVVAIVLAEYANADGTSCYPSQATISLRAGCSNRTTIDALRGLEDQGFIEVREARRRGRGRGWRLHSYLLRVPAERWFAFCKWRAGDVVKFSQRRGENTSPYLDRDLEGTRGGAGKGKAQTKKATS